MSNRSLLELNHDYDWDEDGHLDLNAFRRTAAPDDLPFWARHFGTTHHSQPNAVERLGADLIAAEELLNRCLVALKDIDKASEAIRAEESSIERVPAAQRLDREPGQIDPASSRQRMIADPEAFRALIKDLSRTVREAESRNEYDPIRKSLLKQFSIAKSGPLAGHSKRAKP
jgi:hypothetical protein